MSILSTIESALGFQATNGFDALATRIDPAHARGLAKFLLNAPVGAVRAINVNDLAVAWNTEVTTVIGTLLQAARLGLIDFRFDTFCPHCTGITHRTNGIGGTHPIGTCTGCKTSFPNSLDQNMVVHFSVNPCVRDITKTKAGVGEPHPGVPAIDVINTSEFRLLFGGQVLPPGKGLAINSITIMFTDIYDSTATYSRRGDVEAFRIVREHFDILFEEIKKHRGVVVKTIGDAVMAAFVRPNDAVQCAMATRESFEAFNQREHIMGDAYLKIGIHSGSCIAVTLNKVLDYFGSTVNKAARVQALAGKEEIIISSETAANPDVRETIIKERIPVQKRMATLKGITGTQTVYQF